MIPYLSEELYFPSAELSTPQGIVAIGGDLSPDRLLLAYRNGIFPWYNEHDPIMWWSLDPRMVVYPDQVRVTKSMRSYFNQKKYQVTYDQEFSQVIEACSKVYRDGQQGTWITQDMLQAYKELFRLGIASSVEVWDHEELVGGLYGLKIGKVFCGESMFSIKTNASKFGFISLARKLHEEGYKLIDCQQESDHLKSLGGVSIPRNEFLEKLMIWREL